MPKISNSLLLFTERSLKLSTSLSSRFFFFFLTIVYVDSLSSLFSSKYCYGIRMDQLNMNNIKHHEKINTHTQITKNSTYKDLAFFLKSNIWGRVNVGHADDLFQL